MKFLITSNKSVNELAFNPISREKVGVIKNCEVAVVAEVIPDPNNPKMAYLTVRIKNDSKNELKDFYAMATVSNGVSLTNLGEVFGTSWRLEKIHSLSRGQSITFKLSLRSNLEKIDGSLNLIVSPTSNVDDPQVINLSLSLRSS
jgi:hypothetical protein